MNKIINHFIFKIYHKIIILSTLFTVACYGETEVYFGPNGGAKEAIINHIENSKEIIRIAIFDFTDKDIADALRKANDRETPYGFGSIKEEYIKVYIIMDNRSAHGKKSMYDYLSKCYFVEYDEKGIKTPSWQVKLQRGGKGGIMHQKFAIFDDTCVLTGSTNWTNGGFNMNRENAIFIDDKEVVNKYINYWNYLWEK